MAVPFWQQQAMNMNATEACKTGRTIREIAWQLVYQERNEQKQDFIIQHKRGGKQDRLHVQKRETYSKAIKIAACTTESKAGQSGLSARPFGV